MTFYTLIIIQMKFGEHKVIKDLELVMGKK
jgi:hypothetical protein